ncbi:xanthine dehydrogenase family protein subunit M [Adlercreutzia sp. ZJ138]|uniref:FAD binding domain-containing protein n=1 Tax=Adlercreutzia sp. ZJ138 TaxID=2709405 RepID=UPI0013EB834B|nr:FAD binding domain-containing protein [Adlercreutzia sp. ZJ138]
MLKDYLFPTTVGETVDMLAKYNGAARIIAGGTDLSIDIKKMEPKPEYLIDLRDVEELNVVEEDGDFIKIGCSVTFTDIVANDLLSQHASALVEGAAQVGAVQVRNMGTVGGNIVSAQPAADAAVPLTALDAICVIVGKDGVREVPITEVYEGIGRSKIDSTKELLAFVKIPKKAAGSESAYCALDLRNALALPMICTAVKLSVKDGLVSDVRIVAAPLAPGPTRIVAAEEFLLGKPATDENFTEAGTIATDNVSFRSSLVRGSSEYRHEVLPILVRRALITAQLAAQ